MISVVILQHNLSDLTRVCIESVLESNTDPITEIIVVDNGSDPNEISAIADRFPQVTMIETGENLGFTKGTNVGWRAAKNEYILHLNNDTALAINMIDMLYRAMQLGDKIGYLSGAYQQGHWTNSRADLPDQIIYELNTSGGRNRHGLNAFCLSRSQEPEVLIVPASEVTAFMVTRSSTEAIGYFDENINTAHEVDYSLRLHDAGYKWAVCKNAVYWHRTDHPTLNMLGTLGMTNAQDAEYMDRKWGDRWRH